MNDRTGRERAGISPGVQCWIEEWLRCIKADSGRRGGRNLKEHTAYTLIVCVCVCVWNEGS